MRDEIKQLIEAGIPGAMARVTTEDDVHFEVTVVSSAFEGLSKVKQQQLVYQALGEWMLSGKIHALAMKTYTPETFKG